MGQAKLRGSFEERKAFAIEQKQIADAKAYQEHQRLKLEWAKQREKEQAEHSEYLKNNPPLADTKAVRHDAFGSHRNRAHLRALLAASALALIPYK